MTQTSEVKFMRFVYPMISLFPIFAAHANDSNDVQAPSGNSSVLCVHARLRQEGQRTGHGWVSFYDSATNKATEFHFGPYESDEFQIRNVTVASWRVLTLRRDAAVRGRCVSIGPNQVDALLEKVVEIDHRGRPYKLTKNNCVTTALSIWNATVLPSQKFFRMITPASLYRKL